MAHQIKVAAGAGEDAIVLAAEAVAMAFERLRIPVLDRRLTTVVNKLSEVQVSKASVSHCASAVV